MWGGIFLSSRSYVSSLRARKVRQFCAKFSLEILRRKIYREVILYNFQVRKSGTCLSWFGAGGHKILQLVGETRVENKFTKNPEV